MAVTTRAVGSSSVAAVSLKALLSASDQAATALATAMRTQSFVIIENDVSEHADMSLLYTTIRPEGGGPECSDGARIVAEAEEAALGVLTAQLEGCMDARAGSVHGLRELGYATTTAKRTFNVKQGEGMLKELWPPGQSGDEARTRLNCAFRFLENVCAFSYIVLMSKVREGMSREQALEELKRHGALYDTAAADGPVSASVLQCFWYPNSDGVRENPNCGEHVDQGFLSIEPATAVPGLEVFDFASQSWLSIDLHLNPGDLILFNAETVQRVTRDVCRGTVHRVGKNEAARLSMVFKMRHRASEELEEGGAFVDYNGGLELAGAGGSGGGGACQACSFLNDPHTEKCVMCGTGMPPPPPQQQQEVPPSDLQQLVGMGFSDAQARAALAGPGGVQGALDRLL